MHDRRLLPSLFASALLVAAGSLGACSGAAGADLFSGAPRVGEDAGSATDGEHASDEAGSVPSEDAGNPLVGDGGKKRDASGGDSGPSPGDGGHGDAGAFDAGPATIDCPASAVVPATCDVGSQVCCARGSNSFDCTTEANCAAPAVAVPCDDAFDCDALGQSGDLCCAQMSPNGTKVISVACAPRVDCTLANDRRTLCDPNAADPCPNGGTCKLSTVTFPGFHVCF